MRDNIYVSRVKKAGILITLEGFFLTSSQYKYLDHEIFRTGKVFNLHSSLCHAVL